MLMLSERPVLCECGKIIDGYHAAEPIIALFLCKVKGCSFYVQFFYNRHTPNGARPSILYERTIMLSTRPQLFKSWTVLSIG